MTDQNPPVVVAVGHDPIDAALAFAAGEARRAGCGLRLVHVAHDLTAGPDTAAVAAEVERAGQALLDGTVRRAEQVAGGVEVSGELRVGAVVATVIDAARDARLLVLQHRDGSTLMRVVTRSVSNGVAARAHVPVVSVPAGWTPEAVAARDGETGGVATITVGVDVAERAEWVLRAAVGEARIRGAVIRALHTWRLPSTYGDVALGPAEAEEWTRRAVAEVEAAIDALGADADGVVVEVDARQAHPAAALIEASRHSELLVLGRHDQRVPFGSHLGPIAGAVMRESACPVMLVDPRPPR